MSLTLATCIYTSEPRDGIWLTFNNETDARCGSTQHYHNDGFLTISTPLDACLTDMVVEEDDIVFKNTIKVKGRYDFNSIVMSSDVNIDAQDQVKFWSFFWNAVAFYSQILQLVIKIK